jgi:hypothetical protein
MHESPTNFDGSAHPVHVLDCGPDWIDLVEVLPPVVSREQAVQATADAGYTVLDETSGGLVELVTEHADDWDEVIEDPTFWTVTVQTERR